MGNGFLFLWIAWILWVIIVFFFQSSRNKTMLSFWVLIIISSMNVSVNWMDISISLSFAVLFLGSIVGHARLSPSLYYLFCSLTISIAYASLLFWGQLMPIWLFMSKLYIIPLIVCGLVIFMAQTMEGRLFISLLGLAHGELMYKLIMTGYYIPGTIGTSEFFDFIIVTVSIVLALHMFHRLKTPLYNAGKQLAR